MKLAMILLCFATIYFLIGFGFAVWGQMTADPNDTPTPIWVTGLSPGERVGLFLTVFVPTVLLWPLLLPATIYHAMRGQ